MYVGRRVSQRLAYEEFRLLILDDIHSFSYLCIGTYTPLEYSPFFTQVGTYCTLSELIAPYF